MTFPLKLRIVPWPAAAFRCEICDAPIPFAEDARGVYVWDGFREIAAVAHGDRDVCDRVLS
jgi:hypothetical protein